MKRFICIMLALCLACAAFTSCGDNSKDKTDNSLAEVTSSVDSTVETTSAVKDDSGEFFGQEQQKARFLVNKDLNIVDEAGREYIFIGHETSLWALGEKCYLGSVTDEISQEVYDADNNAVTPGMYSFDVDGDKKILMRYTPHSEWAMFYMRSDIDSIEFLAKNCIRLELAERFEENGEHLTCGKGISGKENCNAFLSEILFGQTAKEAGLFSEEHKLYDSVLVPECYLYGTVYGYFAEDLNIALVMDVWSFDDKAYAISINDEMYVLSQEWLEKLKH